MNAPRETPGRRSSFVQFIAIPTRWADNDVYGHVNNVQYYAFFDTAVNQHLVAAGVLDIAASPVVGLVVETQCRYFSPVTFPDVINVGLRVSRLGNSSVRYEIGIFRVGNDEPCAIGHFVHVFVDRATRRPMPVPGHLRAALNRLVRA